MKKWMTILATAAFALATNVACLGGDDDDDSAPHPLSSGSYAISNGAVDHNECNLDTSLATAIDVTVNGDTVTFGSGGSALDTTRTANNVSGFVEFTFDWSTVNASYNCIDNNTINFDGIITGEDKINMTVTTFIETSSGNDTECQTYNNAATWPCETQQSFTLTGPNGT